MASPFPGMDPYLEGEMWQEFHERFANQVSAQLMPALRPKYVALLEKRYVLEQSGLGIVFPSERVIYPDVHVVRPPQPSFDTYPSHGGVALMEPTVEMASPVLEEIPVLSVEIRDVAERRLVTLIEILSPVNKRGQGAREYADRRLELLQTATHLLEIDLLTKGQRIELIGQLPPAPYYLFLSRVQRRPNTQVWALPLQQPLPRVPVPLLPPDADVVLDLQAAVDACFDLVGYEVLLDYRAEPPAGLSVEDQQWAIERLQQAGLRNETSRNAVSHNQAGHNETNGSR